MIIVIIIYKSFLLLYVVGTLIHIFGKRITAIQFDEIHVPFGERERVQLERSQDPWITGTSKVTIVFIYTELQSSRMNL